jgi:PAS domain-containing protein
MVALTQRWHGAAPLPPSLTEAVQQLFVAFEVLQALNEELIQAQQAAIREQLRYRELFEFAPDGYFVTDLNGGI